MGQITIRNLGQDVRDMLVLYAKANGRSLEAEIRVMLATAVGLGPRDANRKMLDELNELQRTNNEAMAGLSLRLEKAKAQNLSTELTRAVRRKAPEPRAESHPL